MGVRFGYAILTYYDCGYLREADGEELEKNISRTNLLLFSFHTAQTVVYYNH